MSNPELLLARQIIANTDTNLFLTGKAGTGKTTFLRSLRKESPKRMVVVAPTGIAAINAEGVTIHSFFQLPFGPHIPGTHTSGSNSSKRFQFRKSKINILRSVDLIVIDEISMVRADILDAIDEVLRQYRHCQRPFGGVQMLLIGDMQQLAPVAREDEWRMLSPYYDTQYFFSSHALMQSDFVTVELKHVYRQSDELFISILNKVRTNTVDEQTLAQLNSRYVPDFSPKKEEGYIRLTTHNYQAEAINQAELAKLGSMPQTFHATIEKDFPEMSFPTEKDLTLKVGAQVMFIKNDPTSEKAYYNGMIGEVTSFEKDTIVVHTTKENTYVNVERVKWENTRYNLNPTTKEITAEVIGTFTQYPLKTAWAITVHKSQGLTFEHAIIDVQHSFAHGQTYVALSRCKTLEGMVLSTPIPPQAIISNAEVDKFTHDPRHQQPDAEKLNTMERSFFLRTINDLFDLSPLRFGIDALVRLIRENFYSSCPAEYQDWQEAQADLKKDETVAMRFRAQYEPIIMQQADYANDAFLQERIKKGSDYFSSRIVSIAALLRRTNLTTNNQVIIERRDNILQNIQQTYEQKFSTLLHIAVEGFKVHDYLSFRAKAGIEDDPNTKRKQQSKKAKPTKDS